MMEIKKLSVDLLDDWLNYFDHVAFTDNEEWYGCYCMCYHWNEELTKTRAWNCSKADAPYNRECAIDFIKKGKMQGYLAYENGQVVGWCNTNQKSAYDSVMFPFPVSDMDQNHKVKSIVCFCISPEMRGKGIASQLLVRVCTDAKEEKFDYVEVYPFHNDANNAYHGPESMYEKHGFEKCEVLDYFTIYRKML